MDELVVRLRTWASDFTREAASFADHAARDKSAGSREWLGGGATVGDVWQGHLDALNARSATLRQAADALTTLSAALEAVARGTCWCEMGIGNPMATTHSPACVQARAALREVGRG